MKHGVNAFVRTGVGVLGLLVIFVTPEKKERTPGCKTKRDKVAWRRGDAGGRWGGGGVTWSVDQLRSREQ
jgi:hypothetical protein